MIRRSDLDDDDLDLDVFDESGEELGYRMPGSLPRDFNEWDDPMRP